MLTGVIRAHDAGHLALLHARLERRQVAVRKILLRDHRIKVVAICSVPAIKLIRNKVLAASGCLQGIRCLPRMLETLHKVHGVLAREKGIFTSGLNVAPCAVKDTIVAIFS